MPLTKFGARQLNPGVTTLTDAATVTPNSDTTRIAILTSLSQDTTFANPTGTPINGQELTIRISSSSIRKLTWGNLYQSSLGLPNRTSGGGKEDYFRLWYNTLDTKWDLIATNQVPDEVDLSFVSASLRFTGY